MPQIDNPSASYATECTGIIMGQCRCTASRSAALGQAGAHPDVRQMVVVVFGGRQVATDGGGGGGAIGAR